MKVLFCTRDLEFLEKLTNEIDTDYVELINSRGTYSFLDKLSTSSPDLVILDDEVYKSENNIGLKSVTVRKLLIERDKLNQNTVFLILGSSTKTILSLEKTFSSVYFFKKSNLSFSRFDLFLKFCRIYDFLPVNVSDLRVGEKLDCDLYFSGKSDLSEKVFLKKNTVISKTFLSTLNTKSIQHLYYNNSQGIKPFLRFRSSHSTWALREICKNILLRSIDDSGILSSRHSNNLRDQIDEFIDKVHDIVSKKETLIANFYFLPLPRIDEVNYSFNNVIYSLLMSKKIYGVEDRDFAKTLMMFFSSISLLSFNQISIANKVKTEMLFNELFIHFKRKGLLNNDYMMNLYSLLNGNDFGIHSNVASVKFKKMESIKLAQMIFIIQKNRLIKNGELEKKFENKLLDELMSKFNWTQSDHVIISKVFNRE